MWRHSISYMKNKAAWNVFISCFLEVFLFEVCFWDFLQLYDLFIASTEKNIFSLTFPVFDYHIFARVLRQYLNKEILRSLIAHYNLDFQILTVSFFTAQLQQIYIRSKQQSKCCHDTVHCSRN